MNKQEYIQTICSEIRNRKRRESLNHELQDHISMKIVDLMEKDGLSEASAEAKALEQMGNPKHILQKYQETYKKSRMSTNFIWGFLSASLAMLLILLFSFPPLSITGLTTRSVVEIEGQVFHVLSSSEIGGNLIILFTVLAIVFAVLIPVMSKIADNKMMHYLKDYML